MLLGKLKGDQAEGLGWVLREMSLAILMTSIRIMCWDLMTDDSNIRYGVVKEGGDLGGSIALSLLGIFGMI